MRDQWTERLSEYLDDELGAAERTALDAHLASCAECRATLDELRRVVARAAALDDRPPAADLWPDVATRIGLAPGPDAHAVVSLPGGGRRPRRRVSFTVPQLAAATIALVVLSGTAATVLLRSPRTPPPAADLTRAPTAILLNTGTREPDRRYDTAVADLQRTLAQNRGRLDTTTVRVIEKNLRIIDRAIRDAQSALAADPGNSYLNLHLAQERRRKLELLRQAAVLAGARS